MMFWREKPHRVRPILFYPSMRSSLVCFFSFSHFMIHLHIDRVLLSRSDPVAEENVVQRYVPWAALGGFHC
jgi:hypothetical protein